MLAIFDPITLLIAIEEEPFTAAFRLTKSSGKEVANATTVIPITTLEILNFKERTNENYIKKTIKHNGKPIKSYELIRNIDQTPMNK